MIEEINAISFSPHLSMTYIYSLTCFIFICIFLSCLVPIFTSSRVNTVQVLLRSTVAGVIILLLLNPTIQKGDKIKKDDILLVATDISYSNSIKNRKPQSIDFTNYLKDKLSNISDIKIREISFPETNAAQNGTFASQALNAAYSDIPQDQRAGIVLISDGNLHDTPDKLEGLSNENYGPISLILTGEDNEQDRTIELTRAPTYGMEGKDVNVSFIVHDYKNGFEKNTTIPVTITLPDGDILTQGQVTVGKEKKVSLPVQHANENIYRISVENGQNELSLENNHVSFKVQGIRDSLRVLLISGAPNRSERMWRDYLSSDPAIDLIHFTILRQPDMRDTTPQNELSLIAFPFQELFEKKLNGFDLIILDQYKRNNILPLHYFQNIANYVRDGGALLHVDLPSEDQRRSLYQTALGDIFPLIPQHKIVETSYKPKLTKYGEIHPITNILNDQSWPSWHQQFSGTTKEDATILMSGYQDAPLLIIDRAGKGRIAQMTSNQLWIWARDYEESGPYSLLIKRIVHWLMKEPELEDRKITLTEQTDSIQAKILKYKNAPNALTVVQPDKTEIALPLKEISDTEIATLIPKKGNGLYIVQDTLNQMSKSILVGEQNNLETQMLIRRAEPLEDIIKKSGGSIVNLSKHERPDINYTDKTTYRKNSPKINVRNNNEFAHYNIKYIPLAHPFLALFMSIGMILACWHFESRR